MLQSITICLFVYWVKNKEYIKGRGAQRNPANRFHAQSCELYLDDLPTQEERLQALTENPRTKYIEVFPKTIVNKVSSPDLGFGFSMNPYQGCEHGCIYCYARNSHEYWGYSAGAEFEQNILVKKSAADLLRQTLLKKSWKGDLITLAGNTDIYQPIERKLGITRSCLQVFLELKHPVGIITKNALVLRDLDVITSLVKENLIGVTLSLTTLNQQLKSVMEPRTSSVKSVLNAIEKLSVAEVPVNVNMAPIIPAINDEEIFGLVKTVASLGAKSVSYIVVRLNGHNSLLFEDWVRKNFPDRANKVLHQIKDMHGGQLNDSQYGRRMRGEGKFAELIHRQMQLARYKYLNGIQFPKLNFNLFASARQQYIDQSKPTTQLDLFDT